MIVKLYSLFINICVYFFVSTAFVYLVTSDGLSLFSFFLICVVALLNICVEEGRIKEKRKGLIEAISFLILLSVVIIVDNIFLKVQFACAWLLIGYILKNKIIMNYYPKYREYYKFIVISTLTLAIFLALANAISNLFYRALNHSSLYILLSLSVGMLFNRYLRDIDNIAKVKEYHKKQLIDFLMVISASFILTFTNLSKLLLSFIKLILRGPAVLLLYLIDVFGGSAYKIVNEGSKRLNELLKKLQNSNGVEENKQALEQFTDQVVENVKYEPPKDYDARFFDIIVYSIIMIVLLIAVFIFFRWLYNNKFKVKNKNSAITVTKTKLDKVEDKKRKVFTRLRRNMSNLELVRYYYKDIINYAKTHNIFLNKGDTTNEINIKLHDSLNKTLLEDIREVYVNARYNVAYKVTKDDAANMKAKVKDVLKN